MPTFAYRATDARGRTLRGAEEAASADAVQGLLARRGLFPLEIHPPGDGAVRRRRALFVSRRTDVTDFITTFAALLQAGLPLDRSLEVGVRGTARPDVAAAVAAARQRVREGGRLADGLAEPPGLFPPVAIGLIRAAERGGHLDAAVGRLAGYLERERALRARVTSAMIYPLLMLTVGGGAMVVLLLFVLPRFVALLQDSGGRLPRSTAVLIGASQVLTRGLPFLVAGAVALVAAVAALRSSERGRERMDSLLLRVPLLGALRARHATARLASTLSTLLAGGVPLLAALEIACGTTGDAAIAADVRAARDAVRRGGSFSGALGRGRAFPYAFVRLAEVGEETGQLDTLIERAGILLETELERRLERSVALVEPALIVVFGCVIGFVALALLQAIYGIHAEGF
ncbi:MAG TPA: type II secretion system F family protein [Longimicrobiaceae bacterium]|nr:type II secretion system F family protein [Longimicrobiaceae bacterium]